MKPSFRYLLVIFIVLVAGLTITKKYLPNLPIRILVTDEEPSAIYIAEGLVGTNRYDNLDYGIPKGADIIIDREGFATGYSITKHQPAWVSYRLTANEVTNRVAKRLTKFPSDKSVPLSASSADYKGTIYDRGHIAPAADMSWSKAAVSNSFFMSNMSPQVGMFNRGIWRELEMWVRDAAVREESIIVLSGPIFTTNETKTTIGLTKVEVPEYYYKVLLTEKEPRKAIGFILRNEPSTNSISYFACSVDDVESAVGLDFYENLPSNEQERVESEVRLEDWGLTR